MCDQQRLRPACAYAQTDQSLCLSLNYYISVKLLIEFDLVFLSLTGGCTGSSESTLVKMAHCWKSHVTVHLTYAQPQYTPYDSAYLLYEDFVAGYIASWF